jgi:hypothetical protein
MTTGIASAIDIAAVLGIEVKPLPNGWKVTAKQDGIRLSHFVEDDKVIRSKGRALQRAIDTVQRELDLSLADVSRVRGIGIAG